MSNLTFFFRNNFSYILFILTLILINFGGFGTGFFNNYNITVFLGYFSLIIILIYKKDLLLYINGPFLKPIVFIVLSMTISCFFAQNNVYGNIWYRYFSIVMCITFSFLAYLLLSEKKVVNTTILKVLGFCGFLHVIVLLCFWSYLEDPVNYNWFMDLPFFNHIRNFTDFIAIGFLCSLYLFFISEKSINKIFWAGNSIFVLSCVFWSGSRSSLLGILVCIFFMFFYIRDRQKNSLFLIFFLLSSFYISTFFKVNNSGFGFENSIIRTTSGNLNEISSLRYDLYVKVVSYIVDKPFLGYGGEAVKNYIINVHHIEISQSHNFILQILIEFGFLGLLSFIYFIYIFFKRINFSKINNGAIFAILISNIFISSLFNGGFYYTSNLSLLCLFFSCLYYSCGKRGEL
ncbi:MAG: O-antigen ligase family protein [Bacilli bacterium]